MAFVSLSAADLAQDKAFTTTLALQIKDNFDALNSGLGTIAAISVPNGSFEIDSDANGTPDSWTKTTYSGGAVTINTTTPDHGSAGIKMVHPGGAGNGGGYIVSDYIPCSQLDPIILQMVHWASAAGMKNQVILYWYTAAKVACATPTTTVYDNTSNPTSPTLLLCGATPPSTARFFKIRLVGGESSVNVAGSAYFDGVAFSQHSGRSLSAISEGTVAEQSTTSASFIDRGSFTLVPRTCGLPITASFPAELKSSNSDPVEQRFRIGTDYSNTVGSSSTSYASSTYVLTTTAAVYGPVTITQQLRNAGSATAYGRKLTSTGAATGMAFTI